MSEKNTSVFGVYTTRAGVENAVNTLKNAHYNSADISVLFPYNLEASKDSPHEKETRAPEGPAAGAGTGAVTGGVLGWILGIGLVAIPGVGPVLAAGPLVAALACAGVGGAIGGIAGGLIGMGIREEDAKRYEGRIRQGGILLSIHNLSAESNQRAGEILALTGAEEITSTVEPKTPAIAFAPTQAAPACKEAASEYVSPSEPLDGPYEPESVETPKPADYVSPSQPLNDSGKTARKLASLSK